MRTKVRTRLLKFTMAMEIVMAITILGAILASIALLICGSVEKFCCQWESFSIDAFMANAFLIVMGIEFVKMLMLHTYGAVIDVLLFAIARQMIISHEEPMQTLMSVGAVAGIFAIVMNGSIAKDISQEYHIDPRRSASLLDIFASVMQGILPYGAQLLYASAGTGVSAVKIMPYMFYCYLMAVCALVFILFWPDRKRK